MQYFDIRIDNEVYDYLQKHIASFDDNPNTILRRLLLSKKTKQRNVNRINNVKENINLIDHPTYIPSALTQILDVVFLVYNFNLTRIEATNFLAKDRSVYPQTIIDKYCRQLNKKAFQIDQILENRKDDELLNLICNKFPTFNSYVIKFFNEYLKHNKSTIGQKAGNEISDLVSCNLFKTFKDLLNLTPQQLTNVKPDILMINNEKLYPENWTDLDIIVIHKLIKLGILAKEKLPIHSSEKKYFINSKPEHKNPELDGLWKEISPGIYVDTKYNVHDHIRNLYNLIQELDFHQHLQIKVSKKY